MREILSNEVLFYFFDTAVLVRLRGGVGAFLTASSDSVSSSSDALVPSFSSLDESESSDSESDSSDEGTISVDLGGTLTAFYST
jgi:hypothetical protein